MHESVFSAKVTLSTPNALINTKVDIIRYDTYVEVRLIDTSNIFTLFICTISQSDYYILKRDQDILVDYDRFVQILVNLFHSLSINKLNAYFNDGTLRFIENTEFRNICKLELKFAKPEETQYKKYLGDLLSRMESDNVKLIKENTILRDKCLNGDRELKDKIRYLDSEILDYKRRMEIVAKENSILESRVGGKDEEISRLSSKIFSMEGENSQLKYDLEKYQKDNSQSYKDQLRMKENELEESLKEIRIANEIIKKLKAENEELKEYKEKHTESMKNESERVEEMSEKLSSVTKKLKTLEEKYKNVKDELRSKSTRLSELESENKGLSKRLESAQNVYNHFYSKKVEDQVDNLSDTFSLRPESPPPR